MDARIARIEIQAKGVPRIVDRVEGVCLGDLPNLVVDREPFVSHRASIESLSFKNPARFRDGWTAGRPIEDEDLSKEMVVNTNSLRLLSVLGLVLLGCGGGGGSGTGGKGGTTACAPGTEGCACYGNNTCDSGLQCLSHLCVSLTGTGGSAAGTGGSAAGTGGSAA